MQTNKEIKALLMLIDDPDYEVYDTVMSKLLDYGKEIIPSLEHMWEVTADTTVQERIEQLIHRVHFQDLQRDFLDWGKLAHPELLRGAILVARYHYPAINVAAILNQFDKMRKNIWLELNNYLSPLEQANVLNSMFYSYYKLQGNELTSREPLHFFINHLIESKQGNSYSIGVLYLALCEMLDIPIFAVDIPRQLIFAYISLLPNLFEMEAGTFHQVQFYIDPMNGTIYSQKDVDSYLKKLNALDNRDQYMAPISNKRIIYKMLEELSLCYRYKKDDTRADELAQLMQIIGNTDEDYELE